MVAVFVTWMSGWATALVTVTVLLVVLGSPAKVADAVFEIDVGRPDVPTVAVAV